MIDWEGFAEAWETAIEEALDGAAGGDEIAAARESFFAWVGAPLNDEAGYEQRNRAFLEWFVCDRPLDGTQQTPLERLREAGGEPGHRAEALADSQLLVATVAKLGEDELVLKRWQEKEKRTVAVGTTAGIERRGAVLGRVFALAEGHALSPAAQIVEPRFAKGLKKSVKWAATDETEADLYAAAMRFELMRQRYPKAQPDELEARWRELMTTGDGGQ